MPTAKKTAKKTAAKKAVATGGGRKPPARPRNRRTASVEPPGDRPNPFSPLHWPFKKGQTVYYVTSEMQWGGGKLATGTVVHYNPALTGNAVMTKGDPVVTIEPGEGGIGNVATVGVADVADHTPEGRLKLEARVRERLLARAADYDRLAAEARREAHTLLHDPKKPKSGKHS